MRALSGSTDSPAVPQGRVALVGAGPGDPELLTLKALRAIEAADVIFHDELVSAEILALAPASAMRVHVGKRAGDHGIGQAAIHERLIAAAAAGLAVVRLKGGDPFIFGRGGEELEALRAAGIRVDVIPGITAALGCAAEIEMPLTHRDIASRVSFVTAQRAEEAEGMDWHDMAAADMTVVVYMGKANAASVAAGLIAAGRHPATPAAALARGTRPDSKAVVGRLDRLPALVAQAGDGPCLIVVGEVVRHSKPWQIEAMAAEQQWSAA